MASDLTAPILRWAGSKRSLIDLLRSWSPASFERYVEPFARSACLFFSLAPKSALLADRNSELVEFYRWMRYRPRPVARIAAIMPRTGEAYYAIRSMVPANLDRDRRAARFLYLNRMAFNGVYRTNRRGEFNVPMGQRVGSFPDEEHMVACARLLRRAELAVADFAETLADVRRGDFVYLDPPYSCSPAGNYGVYGYGSFDGREVDRLLDVLDAVDRRGATFLLSYAAAPEVLARLRGYRVGKVAVTAQVGGRRSWRSTRDELLVTNA